MREVFHAQLAELGTQLDLMAQKVHTAMSQASQALLEPDLPLAEAVIAGDADINHLQAALDELSVELLARQAPVATDLRVVVSALRMSATLERMGDLATHVAKLVRIRFPDPAVPAQLHDTIRDMTEIAQRMARRAGDLMATRNLDLIPELRRDDDALDALHRDMFNQLTDPQSPLPPAAVIDMALLSRYLERFGDHSVSLAKRVEFLVLGHGERKLDDYDLAND